MRTEQTDPWKRFRGLGNTHEVLAQKAHALVPLCCGFALEQSEQLSQSIATDKTGGQSAALFIESSILLLHLIDRMAFARLSREDRQVFAGTLFVEVTRELSRAGSTGAESFLAALDERQKEYSQHKWQTGVDAFAGGSVLLAFAKRVVESACPPPDMQKLMHARAAASGLLIAVADMQVAELLGS